MTVQIRTADRRALFRLAERLRDISNVQAVEGVDDENLHVHCEREGAFNVITTAHDLVPVDGLEVYEPDLDDVFRVAVNQNTEPSHRVRANRQNGGDGE